MRRSIDRSIVPRFRASFSRRLDYLLQYSLLVVGVVLFVPEETKRASSWSKTHVLFWTRDRVSEICFSLHTNISPLSLSLSLEQHSMLHRRRVRRGPDHGHDRAEVPAHRGKQRASLIKVVFARFITTSSICSRLQNARVQNVPVFDTPPGPGGAIFSITRATQSPKRKDRDERLVALLVVFCRRFSSGVGCSLSLSLSRECNTNPLSSLKCTNLFFLLRTKRSPWSI